jgi:L-threonylcarbamoyladenylate synthase
MEKSDNIEQILALLGEGKIWIHPTDTVWGLGCDATNPTSIQRLHAMKNRPLEKTMILLASDMRMVKEYVQFIHPKIDSLLHYSNRPITVLYPYKGNLPKELVNPYGEVAIRIVREPWLQSIIHAFAKPLVATSANLHGRKFPINFADIDKELLETADYVAWKGREVKTPAEPSVVITINEKDDIVFLRE